MFKQSFLIIGMTLVVGGLAYLNFWGGANHVDEIISRKNPYNRKPASIVQTDYEVTQNQLNEKVEGIQSRLEKLALVKSCYQRKCELSDSDSREYDLSVGNALKKEILSIYEEVLDKEISDENISIVARDYLKIPNGHVKEAALLLLSTQAPSEENLNAVLDDVLNFHDANLVGLALMELEKYKDERYQKTINENFMTNFRSGSLMVKEALAKGMYRFFTEDTKKDFEKILNEMPRNSRVRQNLKASLERYNHRL